MSKPVQTEVTCPRCGRTQDVTVWASVNATVDPALRQLLLNDELNVFRCTCGHQAELGHDLLYHDMDMGFQVWLKYPDEDGSITLEGPALQLARTIMDGYTFRVVRDRNELIEKVLVFEDGLDDRVIEVLKLVILSKMGGGDVIQDARLYYSGRSTHPSEPDKLEFVILDESGEATRLAVGYDAGYHQVAEKLRGELPQQLAADSEWRIVNEEFALSVAGNLYG